MPSSWPSLSCSPFAIICTAANHRSVNQPHCPASTLSAVALGAAGAPGPGGAVVGRRGRARGTAARSKALKASKACPREPTPVKQGGCHGADRDRAPAVGGAIICGRWVYVVPLAPVGVPGQAQGDNPCSIYIGDGCQC
jgi:hypothetical protein